jgi:hypothetical protein
VIFFVLAACSAPDAGPGTTVIAPEDVSTPWDDAYAEADGIGGIFPMEARVLSADGEWLAGVRVSVLSGWDGALVLEPTPGGAATLLDARTGEPHALGACGEEAARGCTWLEGISDAQARFRFDVFVDVAPDSGAKVPVFIAAGDDVVSVEITLDTGIVVH